MDVQTLAVSAGVAPLVAQELFPNQLSSIQFEIEQMAKGEPVILADPPGHGKTRSTLIAVACDNYRVLKEAKAMNFAPSTNKFTGNHAYTTLIIAKSPNAMDVWRREAQKLFVRSPNILQMTGRMSDGDKRHKNAKWHIWTGGAKGEIPTTTCTTDKLTHKMIASSAFVMISISKLLSLYRTDQQNQKASKYSSEKKAPRNPLLYFPFENVIIDECHEIRADQSRDYSNHGHQHNVLYQLISKCRKKIAISATPAMCKHLDLWSIYKMLGINDVPILSQFTREICVQLFIKYAWPKIKGEEEKKTIVFDKDGYELVEKATETLPCDLYRKVFLVDMSPHMKKEYENLRMQENGSKLAKSGNLRKFCQEYDFKDNARTAAVVDYIKTQVGPTEKYLVFCDYTEAAKLFATWLTQNDCGKNIYMTGNETGSNKSRDQVFQEFQESKSSLRGIASTFCSGTTITLTAATHVIFVGTRWGTEIDSQAYHRAYRIGQTAQRVNCVYFLFRNSVEDKIHHGIAKDRENILQKIHSKTYKPKHESGKILKYVLESED